MTRRSRTFRVLCLIAGPCAGATAVWSIDEAVSRSLTVVNHLAVVVPVDETVSRSVTVVNHAVVPAMVGQAISRSVTVVNHVIVVPDITESISRSVSVCNRAGAPDSDGDGVNDCDDTCAGFDDRIDRDGDGVPDACDNCPDHRNPDQADCNHDGEGDVCAIALGHSEDCSGNGIPDECEPDCNGNGIADSCEIAGVTECTVPDPRCVSETACNDCNLNGVPDCCDFIGGSSQDEQGVLNECIKRTETKQEGNWNDAALWNRVMVPRNHDGVTFSPSISGALTPTVVLLNIPVEIDTLQIGDGATLKVTTTAQNNLTVVKPGGIRNAGTLLVANDRSISVPVGPLQMEPGSLFAAEGGTGAASATLTADRVTIGSSLAEPSVRDAQMLLSDSMHVTITGGLTIQANAVTDPTADLYTCSSTGYLNVAGGITPPVLRVAGQARLDVYESFLIAHAGDVKLASSAPMTLGGDFANQSVYPGCFDFLRGTLLMNGSHVQTFEAAGRDRARDLLGFVENFAIGKLELAAGAVVRVVDGFDNQRDGVSACDEVLYVETLTLQPGSSLQTADGCRLYYRVLLNLGGTISEESKKYVKQIAAGDGDGDGDVDAADLAVFLACMQDTQPSQGCLDAFDADLLPGLTMRDFSSFQRNYTGGHSPPEGFPGFLASALPAATASGGTSRVLSRTAKNEIRLDFSEDLPSDPIVGSVRIREMLPGGTFGPEIPMSNFTFTRLGNRLIVRDNASNLSHRHWYQIESAAGMWPGFGPFCLQFVVQAGDCDGNGAVNAADLACINAKVPTLPTTINDATFRVDINGGQGINAADLVAANARIPSLPVARPSGHATCP